VSRKFSLFLQRFNFKETNHENLAMQTKYVPGQIVKAKVTRILPYFGLLVRLEDGSRGFVRRRELSWSEKEPDPGKFAHIGQEIEAIVLDRDAATSNLSLSLRLRQHDPWTAIEKKYPVGKVARGIVTRILPDRGAFVELEQGLDGFIPISFIHPERQIENVEDVLWVDDHVRAIVVEVDAKLKTIHLSIKSYLERKRRERIQETSAAPMGTPIEDIIDQKTRELLYHAVAESEQRQTPLLQPDHIRRILIVDDIAEFGKPLADWLRQKGYEVKLALSGAEGLDLVRQEAFDLIFLDSHLPDTTGIEVAEQINAAHPMLPILLITGYEDEMDMNRAARIEVPIWFKPMAEQDLIEILTTLESTGHLPAMSPISPEKELDFLQQGIESLTTRRAFSQTLRTILNELSRELGVKSLALFRVDAKKREVTLEASQGVPPLSDEHSYNLIYSPVQDVIETNRLVY
jgi:predicted RNA-binding protein with RPS1 domain/DNA-binding response OmpR family regulator